MGKDPTKIIFLIPDYFENLGIEEQSTIISGKTLGNSFILGHPTNGVLGTAVAVGGGQIVLGESGRVETRNRIVNLNKRYPEHFRTTEFKGSPTTADWNITLFRLAMNQETNHLKAYNTVATFTPIARNNGTATTISITAKETVWGNDIIRYFIQTDSNDWQETNINEEVPLNQFGSDIKVRIVFLGSGGKDTYIEDLYIDYSG